MLGNPTRKTDALGRTTWYTYDLKGQLCEIYRPVKEDDQEVLYQRTTYTYDAKGNKTSEQRLSGYWSLDGQLREEEGNGLHLKFSYDKRDRLIRVEDGQGAAIRFRYDVQGKRTYEEKTISDGIRQVIHYHYDRAGRLIETKEELDSGLPAVPGEAKAAITRYDYDENGNRIRIQTPEGYEIFREYDCCDRLSSERTLDKQNGIDRTVKVSYDHAGNITRIARQGKGSEVWELDYQYDLKNRITHVKDCLGPVFRYEYDLNDRLEKEILPQGEQRAETENSFRYSYDLYGNLLSKTNGAGTVLEENQYFADGNISLKRTAEGNELTYRYGIHGLETEVYTTRSRKEGRAAQSYRYDANGRMTGIVDGNQNHTGMDTDSWGRIRSVHNADGGMETYTYNSMGLVTSTTDANGGVITYRYNSQGKVCEIVDQEGNSEIFRYDREGRKVLSIDRNGNQVKTIYNVDGNPVYESGCDAKGENQVTRSWEYDSFGRKKKAVSGGFCYTYEYRPDGKLIKKSSSGQTLVSCTYNKDGSLKTLTDVTGKTLFYGYDWRGNLKNIKDQAGNEIVQYSHYPDGRLETIRHFNGVRTIYEYDTDGNISRLATFVSEKQPLFDFRYDYDLNGNRTAKTGSRVVLGEFNKGKAINGEDINKNPIVTGIQYQYDSMNRLLKETYDGDAVSYQYDLCGNRKEKESVAGKETYGYNRRNQLIEKSLQGESCAYEYDMQGNLLEENANGKKRRYGYNPFGQQTEVKEDNFKLENFYDGEFLRAKTSVNGEISRFLYYNGELQAETYDNDTVKTRYILGYGIAGSETEGRDGYHAYHLDEQNSTAYITGNQRTIENFYEYDAFGSLRQHSEEVKNRILYTGQQYDQETGQYYLRARFYNPVVGRFMQEDVYRGDGLNLYAYCGNNPVVYYDPSGYGKKVVCSKEGEKPEDNGAKGSGGNKDSNFNLSEVGEYGDVGGHHVHAKAGFKGDINYDPQKGFSISQQFMKDNNLNHSDMTKKQRQLFKELYESGRTNTLEEHTRIAKEALKAGGANNSMIDDLVSQSLFNLSEQGVTQPTRIPWYSK